MVANAGWLLTLEAEAGNADGADVATVDTGEGGACECSLESISGPVGPGLAPWVVVTRPLGPNCGSGLVPWVVVTEPLGPNCGPELVPWVAVTGPNCGPGPVLGAGTPLSSTCADV